VPSAIDHEERFPLVAERVVSGPPSLAVPIRGQASRRLPLVVGKPVSRSCRRSRSLIDSHHGLSEAASFEHSDERGYGLIETFGYIFPLSDRAVAEASDDFGFEVRTQLAKVRDQKSLYDEAFREDLAHRPRQPVRLGGSRLAKLTDQAANRHPGV